MVEKDTAETNSSTKNESSNSKYDENKEKINDRVEKGKVFANQAANDIGKGFDDLIITLKSAQKSIDGKINEYKQNTINTLDMDLIEDENNYYLKVAIPGVKKESVNIEMTEKSIHLTCEFPAFVDEIGTLKDYTILLKSLKSGKCKKDINFASEVDIEKVKARYENGLVYIDIPKIEVKKHKVDLE